MNPQKTLIEIQIIVSIIFVVVLIATMAFLIIDYKRNSQHIEPEINSTLMPNDFFEDQEGGLRSI